MKTPLILAAGLIILLVGIYFLHTYGGSSLISLAVKYSTLTIEKLGYPGIFLLMVLESALVPIPSEVVMTFAGFLAWSGKMDLLLVVGSGTLGNLVGSYLLYRLGEGPGLSAVEKYGKYFLIEEEDILNAQALFQRYGGLIILTGRMLPAVRTVISLPAGMARMDVWKFLVLTLVGSIPWNAMLAYLGWVLGENWVIIENYTRVLDYAAAVLLVLAIAWFYTYKSRRKAQRLNGSAKSF